MISMPYIKEINFGNGLLVRAVEAAPNVDADAILKSLAFAQMPNAIIPISGGALKYPSDVVERTRLLVKAIVDLAFEHQIMLVYWWEMNPVQSEPRL